MVKTFSLGLEVLKVWFNVRLESSNYRKLLFNFCKAQLINRVRLDRSKIMDQEFSVEFSNQPKPI